MVVAICLNLVVNLYLILHRQVITMPSSEQDKDSDQNRKQDH